MDNQNLYEEIRKAVVGYETMNGGVRSKPRTEALKNLLFNNHKAILAALADPSGNEEIAALKETISKKDQEIQMLNAQLDESDEKYIALKKENDMLKKSVGVSRTKKKSEPAEAPDE